MSTQQLPVLHRMNNFLLQRGPPSAVPLLFKNYSLVEAVYLLIRFNKSFL